jgi:lipoyl(octanoyl) transferase
MDIRVLGVMRYAEALVLMEATHREVAADPDHPGVILVVEHPPVVTMGNRPLPEDMHVTPEFLGQFGVDFHKIDRGGSVTVHEPGQAVVYPIVRIDATHRTVKRFVSALEEAMILICSECGITANRDPINAGVWVGQNKIGAVGVRILERASKHGLAFNVNNSLDTFRWIIPCGLRERGVTTLAREREARGEAAASPVSVGAIGVQIARHVQRLLV